jgi:hypothetical protein
MHTLHLTDKFTLRVAANGRPNVLAGPMLRHARTSVTARIALGVNLQISAPRPTERAEVG